jgi:hypothetical protein
MIITKTLVLIITHELLELFTCNSSLIFHPPLYQISYHIIFDITVVENSILSFFETKWYSL